jgi:hypothetical protein
MTDDETRILVAHESGMSDHQVQSSSQQSPLIQTQVTLTEVVGSKESQPETTADFQELIALGESKYTDSDPFGLQSLIKKPEEIQLLKRTGSKGRILSKFYQE